MKHKLKNVEASRGRPVRDVLIDLFKEKGTQAAVAGELGVNQSTVSQWLVRSRLSIQSVLVDDVTGERVS